MIQVGDNFNRADSADLGVNWEKAAAAQAMQIVSNRVEATTPGAANETGSAFHVVSLESDQFAQVDLVVFTGAFEVRGGLFVRCMPLAGAADPAINVYTCSCLRNFGTGQTSVIEKVVAGSGTTIATESATTWVSGDVIRFEIIGRNLRLLRNGVSLLTAIDSDISGGGWPGLKNYVGAGGSLADCQLDNWLGGDMSPLNNFNFPKPKIRDAARAGWIA